MRYAIYCRKSRFTGRGESVENQEQLCRQYIERMDPEDNSRRITVFEDEGYSGKNTRRPRFQQMMAAVATRQFDFVICYRLDRISRSVGDFSTTYNQLRKYGVSFISISEKFDTSSSMGEAMMFISSIFSQLERNIIAERIRDNMLMLAKTGRWLGGITPLGFRSAQVRRESVDGKERTSYTLAPVQAEQRIVLQLYTQYREMRTLTQVETWCIQQDIRTRQGNRFSAVAIREILANPVYCMADEQAFQYFGDHNSLLCNEQAAFNGAFGIAAYNRTATDGSRQVRQPIEEWIVAIGKHRGIIPGGAWVEVQKLLLKNHRLSPVYKPRNPVALLSGLLYCNACGSTMRPRVNSRRQHDRHGEQTFAYLCELKRKSKGQQCQCPNISGNTLDDAVCKEVLYRLGNNLPVGSRLKVLQGELAGNNTAKKRQIRRAQQRITVLRREIDDLIAVLARTELTESLLSHTSRLVKEKDEQLRRLKEEVAQLSASPTSSDSENRGASTAQTLLSFSDTFFAATVADRRSLLHSIIRRVEWNGAQVHIFFRETPP